jgi:hypothetical protein
MRTILPCPDFVNRFVLLLIVLMGTQPRDVLTGARAGPVPTHRRTPPRARGRRLRRGPPPPPIPHVPSMRRRLLPIRTAEGTASVFEARAWHDAPSTGDAPLHVGTPAPPSAAGYRLEHTRFSRILIDKLCARGYPGIGGSCGLGGAAGRRSAGVPGKRSCHGRSRSGRNGATRL